MCNCNKYATRQKVLPRPIGARSNAKRLGRVAVAAVTLYIVTLARGRGSNEEL